MPYYQQPPPPKKKSRIKLIVLGAIGLLVVCAVIGAILKSTGYVSPSNLTATALANPVAGNTGNGAVSTTVASGATTTAPAATKAPASTDAQPSDAPAPTDEPEATNEPEATAVPEASEPAVALGKIDERIVQDGVAYTVSEVAQTQELGPYSKAGEGEVFETLLLTIENVEQDKPVSYNLFYASLRDVDGYHYSAEILGDSQQLKSGELPKGDTIKGSVAFRIPADAKGLVFEYKVLSFDATPPLSIALDDQNVEPAPVEGQRIEQDGVAITVTSVERTEKLLVPAEEGKEFILIDLLVENISGPEQLSVNPFYFTAKDEESFEYTLELIIDRPTLKDASLFAGQRNRGIIAFEVPKGAKIKVTYSPLGRKQPDPITIPIDQ
jgi:hypothetical protein